MLPQRGGEIIHGTGQHVSKKIRTQAESVGDGHEDGRRDFIVSRRAPAAERFKSHELPRANSTQWLVGQFDLAALQCKHQPLLDGLPSRDLVFDQQEREQKPYRGTR
ncbi:hypothetical protein G6F57_018334 [Rhizopus arrhizus]|nr:hypothetical protein [Stenotrophomonas maltophilia]KAG1442659.1 hypothetical protein G6F57_018334 [Rhizopus arrhizus]